MDSWSFHTDCLEKTDELLLQFIPDIQIPDNKLIKYQKRFTNIANCARLKMLNFNLGEILYELEKHRTYCYRFCVSECRERLNLDQSCSYIFHFRR